ncbi:hypothetical protein [Streptomyces californicus]|uniref:hypothetical protein n=1 Tax=Streptomyces californicus TaxID=67351 RepID=UPI0004C1DDFB|nr:hypothetical protein [Streptomyces californicus]QRV59388.1 hypothetical protein I6J40_34580 [Streptomyces californicus]
MEATRDTIAATHRRIARVTNALLAELPPEAVSGTIAFGKPAGTRVMLNEDLTAADILNKSRMHDEGGFADPHWVLQGVHPELWNGRKPTRDTQVRTTETDQTIPAPARQALSAATSFGAALLNWRKASPGSHHPDEVRERAAGRVALHLADANAILDILEPELGLTEPAEQGPDQLPSVAALAALPPITRAIAAIRARDTADRSRTVYADVLGEALAELKQTHGRGWTTHAANALGMKPSSADEALRRYQRRLNTAHTPNQNPTTEQ